MIDADIDIAVPEMSSEGWGNLNGALTEAVRDKDSRIGKLLATVTRNRMVDGDVVLGPAYDDELAAAMGTDETSKADVVVLASGNLGLVSFTDIDGRATIEADGRRASPASIAGLAEHPGIGFVLVRSETLGGLVIGGAGNPLPRRRPRRRRGSLWSGSVRMPPTTCAVPIRSPTRPTSSSTASTTHTPTRAPRSRS